MPLTALWLRLPRVFLVVVSALPACAANHVPALVSGEPVPVATQDRRGPLSVGLSNIPVAALRLSPTRSRPDLLVAAGKHSPAPGLYLFRYSGDDASGAPVFTSPVRVPHPGGDQIPPPRYVWQQPDGLVHAFWLVKGRMLRTSLDLARVEFVETAPPLVLPGLPRGPSDLAVLPLSDGSLELFFTVSDGARRPPPGEANKRSPDYLPYDGALIYRGTLSSQALYAFKLVSPDSNADAPARLVSSTESEALFGFGSLAWVDRADASGPELIGGTRLGNFYAYRKTSPDKFHLAPHTLVAGPDGVALRHPTMDASPIAYPDADGRPAALIAGGEGCLYYYAPAAGRTALGAPAYQAPVPVTVENALLYPGSLPVLDAADWDGDRTTDLVAGNSEGKVLIFRNLGTDRTPAFSIGKEIHAAGEPIHLQQGYVGVQGPQEQRWGYSCPRVFDWNGDGRLDLVMSGASATHDILINLGAPGAPRLDHPRRLYSDGLDLHGTWRVQPGLARVGGKVAYVLLDDEDAFHLYWRIDDRNLADGGKLRLEDGSPIIANFLHAGGTGRAKIQLVDWDLDGRLDLLIGTPRHGSVPEPKTGLPQSLGLKGAAILFLKNLGTDEAPMFAFPTLMKFRGRPIYHGQHACGPVATDLGAPGGPNLFVGSQDGRIHYYARADLSWDFAN